MCPWTRCCGSPEDLVKARFRPVIAHCAVRLEGGPHFLRANLPFGNSEIGQKQPKTADLLFWGNDTGNDQRAVEASSAPKGGFLEVHKKRAALGTFAHAWSRIMTSVSDIGD